MHPDAHAVIMRHMAPVTFVMAVVVLDVMLATFVMAVVVLDVVPVTPVMVAALDVALMMRFVVWLRVLPMRMS